MKAKSESVRSFGVIESRASGTSSYTEDFVPFYEVHVSFVFRDERGGGRTLSLETYRD